MSTRLFETIGFLLDRLNDGDEIAIMKILVEIYKKYGSPSREKGDISTINFDYKRWSTIQVILDVDELFISRSKILYAVLDIYKLSKSITVDGYNAMYKLDIKEFPAIEKVFPRVKRSPNIVIYTKHNIPNDNNAVLLFSCSASSMIRIIKIAKLTELNQFILNEKRDEFLSIIPEKCDFKIRICIYSEKTCQFMEAVITIDGKLYNILPLRHVRQTMCPSPDRCINLSCKFSHQKITNVCEKCTLNQVHYLHSHSDKGMFTLPTNVSVLDFSLCRIQQQLSLLDT